MQQLLELRWRKLCACDGHGHPNLCELDLNVGLLQITEECGGRKPLRGAIRRTLNHINHHFCPERQNTDDTSCDCDYIDSILHYMYTYMLNMWTNVCLANTQC